MVAGMATAIGKAAAPAASAASARAWNQLDAFVARESVRWAARAERLLLAEGARAADAYESPDQANHEQAALAAVSEPAWRTYINTLWLAIAPAAAQLAEPWLPKAAADPFYQATVRYLGKYGAERAAQLSAKSRAGIADQIRIGIKKGESQKQIAARIRKHYRSVSPARAKTIARTEVHAAGNFGVLTAAEETQIPLYKVWIHTPDGRARDSHIAAEGQRRLLDEPFSIGGYPLQFPGDASAAPPAETINCRCAMRFERAAKPVPARPARRRRAA